MQDRGGDRPRRRGDMLEAPPSRYRVIEKNGRLVVLDNGSADARDAVRAAPAAPLRMPDSRSSVPDAGGQGWEVIDRWATMLADRFSERREGDGRLVLRARGTQRQIVLGPAQARGYGWGLLAIAVAILLLFPVNIVAGALGGGIGAALSGVAMLLGIPLAVIGGLVVFVVRTAASTRTTK